MIRVLLVDDHTILRQGLKQLLAFDGNITVVGEAENGEEAVVKALSLKPDVILMDINMPKLTGYEACQAILTAWPDACILVLTNQDDRHVIKKFMDLAIRGFLLKDVDVDHLIDSIYRAMAGETVELADELQERLGTSSRASKSDALSALTQREKEVLAALAKGYSNQQLAELLTVSPKTVHNHLYNIYSKINVSSRSEAIVWAIENGMNR